MIRINKSIEIVSSSNIGLSSMSQKSRQAVFTVLAKHYAGVRITLVNNLSDLETLVARKPDLVFLGMKFLPSDPSLGLNDPNKIWLPQYLDEHAIAYTGSNRIAHELEHDKTMAKQRVLDAGLSTSPFFVLKQGQQITEDTGLPFPLFVKPTNRGGGVGIDSNSLIKNQTELRSKVRSIADELQADSLIEAYLPGREFSVAILKNAYTDKYSAMPLELIAPVDKRGARILSAQVKSADTEQFTEIKDEIVKSNVTALALNVFHALGARDYGRIDIRLDKTGIPNFLEANLLPSLIEGYGNFPKACMLNLNLGYEAIILSIVRLAMARNLDLGGYVLEPGLVNNAVLPSLETAFESV